MSQKPDFTTDFSGAYPRARLIPKRPDAQAEEGSSTNQQEQPPAPSGATAARTHLWFEETTIVPDAFRKLLVEYSHIPPEEVDDHVVKVVCFTPPIIVTLNHHHQALPHHLIHIFSSIYSATVLGKSTPTPV